MATLIDTCVLSEFKKPRANPQVLHAIDQLDPLTTFISVITLGELTKGCHRLPPGKRRTETLAWVDQLIDAYADRTLGIGLDVARTWGQVTARALNQGRTVSIADGLIAATAIARGLTVMTRNVSDFEPTGVLTTNPWQG